MTLSYDQYDANANIQHITNTLDPTKNKSFTYDNLDRLATATASGIWGSLGWTYDGVGNRQTEGSTVYTYTAGTPSNGQCIGLKIIFRITDMGTGTNPFSWNRCLGFGHLCPLINPTGADNNVDDWIDAARRTQDKLDSWKKMCGCKK